MKLELGIINIKDVKFGKPPRIEGHVLYVDKEKLRELVLEDDRIAKADIELAKPGEKIRIMPVKDVIEPRVKVRGPSGIFPGLIGPAEIVGRGQTNVLRNTAVVTVGKIVGYQEGMIDMSGPGARYTPFSETLNIVLLGEPVQGIEEHMHEEAIRIAGLKVAAKVGELGRDIEPDEVESYEVEVFPALKSGLPRVVYVLQTLAQGLLHDTYVYGVDCKGMLPTIVNPLELMDGSVVSGNCVSACDKNTTYHYENEPIIKELLKRHNKELYFSGVVISPTTVRLASKEKCTDFAAKLCHMLRADGAVITEEGFGNPEIELMMHCKKLEKMGIKTVLVSDEYAGPDGKSQGLADTTPEANAFISAGNANEIIEIPEMDKVIGDDTVLETLAGGRKKLNGSLRTEIQAIIGSTNGLGYTKLRCISY
ncbi:MAG: glycine/sarcosine/betaine reductase component B subunit [Candidatus Bathyarchaeia archaeon]